MIHSWSVTANQRHFSKSAYLRAQAVRPIMRERSLSFGVRPTTGRFPLLPRREETALRFSQPVHRQGSECTGPVLSWSYPLQFLGNLTFQREAVAAGFPKLLKPEGVRLWFGENLAPLRVGVQRTAQAGVVNARRRLAHHLQQHLHVRWLPEAFQGCVRLRRATALPKLLACVSLIGCSDERRVTREMACASLSAGRLFYRSHGC